MEPDPRHVDILKETCGFGAESRSVNTPGDKKSGHYDDETVETARYHSPSVSHHEIGIHRCRRHVQVFQRADRKIHVETHDCCAWCRLMRAIHAYTRHMFKTQGEVHHVDIDIDSDRAQDRDRKSVSRTVAMTSTRCSRVHVAT